MQIEVIPIDRRELGFVSADYLRFHRELELDHIASGPRPRNLHEPLRVLIGSKLGPVHHDLWSLAPTRNPDIFPPVSSDPLVVHWTAEVPVKAGFSALQVRVVRP